MKKLNIMFFSEVVLWLITALSVIINFNHFIMGKPTALDLIVTIIFVAVWFAVMLFGKGRKNALAMTIWSGITLITAIAGLPIALLNLDGGFLTLFALVFWAPYNGLAFIMPGRWEMIYSIMIAVSGLLTALGLFQLLRKPKQAKNTDI